MEKFKNIKSIPAYLPLINIDTDMIIPKQFLKTIKRSGLGKSLFYEMRFDEQGNPIKNFVLNNDPYKNSKILISGKNFGCGSSREHAPWALVDFGIRCVISQSFADIFYNNCFKNGILPIVVQDNIEHRNVSSGFYITPKLRGDNVVLTVSPRFAQLNQNEKNVINVQNIDTTVHGKLGEWISIGGIDRSLRASDKRNLINKKQYNEEKSSILIKVDEIK